MNEINLLKARMGLMTTKLRIELTLDEIKAKRPEAQTYIDGMTKGIEEIIYGLHIFNEMEKELRIARQRNRDMEIKLLQVLYERKQEQEEKELESKIKQAGM
jgi:hypothetical protein